MKIYIETLQDDYLKIITEGLQWLDAKNKIKQDTRIFLKPNLTYPHFRRGVMTNPQCVEALVIALKDYTDKIVIGEADSGGYNRFKIDDVFAKTGLNDIGKKYGVRVVNLSRLPYRNIQFEYRGRDFHIPLPVLLLDDTDTLITIPVPKIHMNTYVSISVKNQWGCIPEPSIRLKLHPFFEKVIYEVNRNIHSSIAVIDGKYGLNRSGPMKGDVVDLNWLMIADNIYAADRVVCELMQIQPSKVYYLNYLKKEGVLPELRDIKFNKDYALFVKDKFFLKRLWTDYPGLWAFRSTFLSYLAYYSPFSDFLHKILYLFREPFYDYEKPDNTKEIS